MNQVTEVPTLKTALNVVTLNVLSEIIIGYAKSQSVTYLTNGLYGQDKKTTVNFCHIYDAMYEIFHTYWHDDKYKDLKNTLTAISNLYEIIAMYGYMNRLVILCEGKLVFTFADRKISYVSRYSPGLGYRLENERFSDTSRFKCIRNRIKNVESVQIIDDTLLIATDQEQIKIVFTLI